MRPGFGNGPGERGGRHSATLKGDEKQPVAVKLRPVGSIKGRLLDLDGKLLMGVVVDLFYRNQGAYWIHEGIYATKEVVTDATGAFALDELIPELKFELSFQQGKRRFERTPKPAEPTVQVKPGECRDLGTLKLQRLSERAGE